MKENTELSIKMYINKKKILTCYKELTNRLWEKMCNRVIALIFQWKCDKISKANKADLSSEGQAI